jgi:POT family proton-dependent oligopeptide transporter
MFKNHPKGLAPLFFTEMWERLAFYMLVGTLVLYASDVERGGLGLTDDEANRIYGAYLAFVYFTPFLGGMIADRILGYRRSVLIGGLFFAAGLVLLGLPGMTTFTAGLVLLCCGNGLFKPNISAMVGNLYQRGDPQRDIGFNIFYMGINIGAAVANLLAAPIRNLISWQWMFWAAAIGIGIGVVILLANWKRLEAADRRPERTPEDTSFGEVFGKILLPAVVVGTGGYFLANGIDGFPIAPNYMAFLAGMLPVIAFFVLLPNRQKPEERAGLRALLPVFVAGGTFFMILHLNGSALTTWANKKTDRQVGWVPGIWQQDALPSYYEGVPQDLPRPDPRGLFEAPDAIAKAIGTKKLSASQLAALPLGDARVVTLWTHDGEGVSPEAKDAPATWTTLLSTFVYPDDQIVDGKLAEGAKANAKVVLVREVDGKPVALAAVTAEARAKLYAGAGEARLPPGEFMLVVSPEVYQSWNPIWVVLLTPLVVMFFAGLVRKGRPMSTPRKLFYGMLLTSGAMLIMAVAGWLQQSSGLRVGGYWLVLAYFVITVGELCLSPMGLSLVTKLSPKRLVGLMMGGWFCATAFGNKLSGLFGELQSKMDPMPFFLLLTGAALVVAMFLRFLLPKLEATMQQYGA